MPRPIDDLELFYAHALAIEREALDRYEEFRTYFADRREEVFSGLCEQIAREERAHYEKLVRASSGMSLPPIDAAKYRWLGDASPEAPSHEAFYRVSTPRQLLELALAGELAARRFFRWVTRTSRDPAVRAVARTLANEEAEHARWVMDALQYREPALDWEKTLAAGAGPGAAGHD
jgi:rubrerythrin